MTTLTFDLHAPEGAPLTLELADNYDLICVDYRDRLDDEQVAQIVRGDMEGFWDSTAEYESDAQYQGAEYVADGLLAEAGIAASEFDQRDELIDAIRERDNSDWVSQLARNTPATLLRIEAIDEDHAYQFEPVSAERVLTDLGLVASEANLRAVGYALANASPEYGVLMGYWILAAEVKALYDLSAEEDAEIEIINPFLYLGNPFAGSGFITEEALEGTVRVKRGELRTDKDAFGYPVDEIYGGLSVSQFECELRPAAQSTA